MMKRVRNVTHLNPGTDRFKCAHAFHDYNVAFILIFAVLMLLHMQHSIRCEQFFLLYKF